MLERTFAQAEDSSEDKTPGDPGEPEYVFEGYDIEFSEKIMLTPPAPKPGAGQPTYA